jgi:hypothetical protein
MDESNMSEGYEELDDTGSNVQQLQLALHNFRFTSVKNGWAFGRDAESIRKVRKAIDEIVAFLDQQFETSLFAR